MKANLVSLKFLLIYCDVYIRFPTMTSSLDILIEDVIQIAKGDTYLISVFRDEVVESSNKSPEWIKALMVPDVISLIRFLFNIYTVTRQICKMNDLRAVLLCFKEEDSRDLSRFCAKYIDDLLSSMASVLFLLQIPVAA